MKRIAILTSGGDSPGMNACIRAVVRASLSFGFEVYGVKRGYEGLIEGAFEPMNVNSVADIIHRGGTILGTSRSSRFVTEEGQLQAIRAMEAAGIEALVVIGGDGSLHGAAELMKRGIPVIGLPGTIDNDLGYTEYTIGFDTAVNTALGAIGNIRDTSSSHGRTVIFEVMGRNCGDIALFCGLAGGAETILVPEVPLNLDDVVSKILAGTKRGKIHSIIVKAEGVPIESGQLAKELQERTGLETKVVILGYIQRGGSPTAADRLLASRMGVHAAQLLEKGVFGRAVGVSGDRIFDTNLLQALETTKPSHTDFRHICDILA